MPAGAGTAVSVSSVETAYGTAQAVAGDMGAGDGACAGARAGAMAADCTVEHCL